MNTVAAPQAMEPPSAGDPGSQLPVLWRYLRMHGALPVEADDLAQEAMVIAIQKGAISSPPAALAVFLRRTARFLFLRLRRADRGATLLADAVDRLWQRDCEADGGEAMVLAARECVAALNGRARRAIELLYGLGGEPPASRATIARELGMLENGVKTLLQRARQQLRRCIERRMDIDQRGAMP